MSIVGDIAIEPPILLKPSMRLREVIPKLSELRIRVAPVVNDEGVLVGVLSYRTILSKGVGRDTKVSTAMDPPYSINIKEPIDKAIALMVSWRARDVPVVNGSGMVMGYINRTMILRYLLDNNLVPSEPVDSIMSSPAITIHEKESIARARWLMLNNSISRLPVVNESNKVVGVITLSDIVERLYNIKLSRRKGYEWIESEESFLAASIADFMSSPPITVLTGISTIDAVKLMLDKRISGLPVVSGEDLVVGVISGIDVLERYIERFATVYPIKASIGKILEEDPIAKTSVERIVENYLAGFSKYVNIIDFKISVKELKKLKRTTIKDVRRGFQVSAKIVTDVGSFTAKSMCWDLPTCVREVLSVMEKRIRKEIEKRRIARFSPRKE